MLMWITKKNKNKKQKKQTNKKKKQQTNKQESTAIKTSAVCEFTV